MSWDEGLIQSLKEVAYPPELYHYTNISESIEAALWAFDKSSSFDNIFLKTEMQLHKVNECY